MLRQVVLDVEFVTEQLVDMPLAYVPKADKVRRAVIEDLEKKSSVEASVERWKSVRKAEREKLAQLITKQQ